MSSGLALFVTILSYIHLVSYDEDTYPFRPSEFRTTFWIKGGKGNDYGARHPIDGKSVGNEIVLSRCAGA
ncbi:hypothetical protein J27TS7_07150 [Paenibacillus dendritiformis]|nr:hypothetical protein J27TS7_07150 [Paenibacillus dendritiformis]